MSVSEKVSFAGVSEKYSETLDYGATTSTQTIHTSTTKTDDSTGFTLQRGIGTNDNNTNFSSVYNYSGMSYIFSLDPPVGQLQVLDLDSEVQGNGYIQVSHTVDMLNTGVAFWTAQYGAQRFDLALNHPARWSVDKTRTEGVQFNCPLSTTPSVTIAQNGNKVMNGTCVASDAPTDLPNPTNLAIYHAPFYQMKGFFIFPEGGTGGPTISQATQGDTITLEARIHNYSLLTIPGSATVKARFYAQPTDAGGNFLDWTSGDPANQGEEADWLLFLVADIEDCLES